MHEIIFSPGSINVTFVPDEENVEMKDLVFAKKSKPGVVSPTSNPESMKRGMNYSATINLIL